MSDAAKFKQSYESEQLGHFQPHTLQVKENHDLHAQYELQTQVTSTSLSTNSTILIWEQAERLAHHHLVAAPPSYPQKARHLMEDLGDIHTVRALQSLPLPITIFDLEGRFRFCNEAFSALFNQTPSYLQYKLLNTFSIEAYQNLCRAYREFEKGKELIEHEHHMRNRCYAAMVKALRSPDDQRVEGALITLTDITALKRKEQVLFNKNQQLIAQLKQDALTGMVSRVGFEETLGVFREDTSMPHICLLMINVDHFRRYNQLMGYEKGDQIMVHLTQLLRDELTEVEHELVRFNAEEIVVVLPHLSQWSSLTIAERMRQQFFEQAYIFEEDDTRLSLSIGLYCLQNHDMNISNSQIVQNLQRTVHNAKQRGRNCCELYAPI